jgi:hypothetical protein
MIVLLKKIWLLKQLFPLGYTAEKMRRDKQGLRIVSPTPNQTCVSTEERELN